MKRRLTLLILAACCAAPSVLTAAETNPVSFINDVRPILSDKCYACHGPDANQRMAGLRLDTKEGAFAETNGYAVILPGDPDNSVLVQRLRSGDPDFRMPPPHAPRPITPEQIETLVEWVRQGAVWEEHWAYVPPKRPAQPQVQNESWASNPIDRFVLARLEAEGLQPSPAADKRALIRRLAFDLTGLPPTPEETDAYMNDARPNAYEAMVDRFMGKTAHGERMATHWLDLVRYADTSGYHSDENVSVWPYRDYVIRAFNENMPYDRFTRENLAGDLLPNATVEQRVASAFNRLNQTTAEGGAQAKEYHAIYAADRVRAVSTVWMGATVGCAQCHDHKFDPYTAKDFYSFAAFFADIEERGVYRGRSRWEPIIELPTEPQAKALAEIDAEILRFQKLYDEDRAELLTKKAEWEAETSALLASDKPTDWVWIDDELNVGGKNEGEWKAVNAEQGPVFRGQSSWKQTAAEGQLTQRLFKEASRKVKVGKGDSFYVYIWLDPENPPSAVMLQFHTKGWESRAFWGEDVIEYGGIGTDAPSHRAMGALPALGEWVRLEAPAEAVGLKPGVEVNGMAFTQFGGTTYWDEAGVQTTEGHVVRYDHPANALNALSAPAAVRTTAQEETLDAYYRSIAPELSLIRSELDALRKRRGDVSKNVEFCITTVSGPPRIMRILNRGDWQDDTGEVVYPNTPTFLPGMGGVNLRRATRLDLANWLVSRSNPMTARAFVNRLWAVFFGEGLSRVLDDLGAQGEPPVNAELLDWLAVEFMDSGWNVKHMVRLIATSSAYRQSSRQADALRERDPYNRLLARQSARRLDAEMIRDNALFLSGLLSTKIGGPSARPYQPKGYYSNLNFPKRAYAHDKDENQYRRGLYTHWQRTFPHPSMTAFDAPSRQECAAQRSRSNTPTQALVLLNDPTYVEAAKGFAARIMRYEAETPNDRIQWAYRQALSRAPTAEETEIMSALYAKHAASYAEDAEGAKALAAVGASDAPEGLNPVELAAWTSVARVLLNLHETITRY